MTTEQQAILRRLAMTDYNAAIERRAPQEEVTEAFEEGLRECRELWEGEEEDGERNN